MIYLGQSYLFYEESTYVLSGKHQISRWKFSLGRTCQRCVKIWQPHMSKVNVYQLRTYIRRPYLLIAELDMASKKVKVRKYNFLTFPGCFSLPIISSNFDYNCSNWLDMRNLLEQVKMHSVSKICSELSSFE